MFIVIMYVLFNLHGLEYAILYNTLNKFLSNWILAL